MNRKGFTLLEILIAFILLAIILVTIYEAFFGHVKAMEATRLVEERYQIGRTALDILTREIEGAYLGMEIEAANLGSDKPPLIFLGIDDQSVEGIPRDTIHFVTTSSFTGSNGWTDGGLREITYRVAVDPETEEELIMRREDITVDDDLQTGGSEQILAEGIKGLDFLFIDGEGNESETWDDAETNRLPVAVRITIIIAEEGTDGLSLSSWTSIPLSLD